MPGLHAKLSPSGASRWLACTPSARLEEQFPDRGSEAASEGTHAHEVGELLIREKLGLEPNAAEKLKALSANKYHSDELLEICEEYSVFVMEQFAEAQSITPDAVIFTETRIDLSMYIPEGFGTGDVFIVSDRKLRFIDLKYGKGVPVSAVSNAQMMTYAAGALHHFGPMYDIDEVEMTIYQPRIGNVSAWSCSVEDLQAWVDHVLVPGALQAFDGLGNYVPGDHCRFCKARGACKALADYQLEIAKYEFAEPVVMTDEQIADVLTRANGFTAWINSVQEHALHEALVNEKQWPGWKLVEGRSNRKYSDEAAVIAKLIGAGWSEDVILKPRAVLSITALEKAITKKLFQQHVSPLVYKPAGKPTLVPESDKREPLDKAMLAASDFADLVTGESDAD